MDRFGCALGWPLVFSLVAGCPTPSAATRLELDGPPQVRVESLGPVDGPALLLSDGTKPTHVAYEASPATVASVDDDGNVIAVGPGQATITARWDDQQIAWTLVVEPAIALHFVDPPARLRTGDHVPLVVEGHLGDDPIAPGPLRFSSSAPAVATVNQQGVVTGVSPGTAYITVTANKSEAMVEIEIAR